MGLIIKKSAVCGEPKAWSFPSNSLISRHEKSFILVLLALSTSLWADPYKELVSKLEINKVQNLDDSLKYLFEIFPEFKDRFSLVYSSRSPVEASLEYPRATFTAV